MKGISKGSVWTVGALSLAHMQCEAADANHEEGRDFHKFNCPVLRILE